MSKIKNFKIIDKKTIELVEDAKKGDQIDLSINQSIDYSNLDESIRENFDKKLKEELSQQEAKLRKQLDDDKTAFINKTMIEIEKKVQKENDTKFALEIANLKAEIKNKEISINANKEIIKTKEWLINSQKENFEKQLQLEVEKMLKARSFSNSKQVGEDLEKWCNQEFEKYQTIGAFNSCEWNKINISNNHEKADYMFKVYSPNKNLLTSVCCEMKNEQDAVNQASKKKNSDHYKKLDRNRNDENAEYALLISTLEKDDDFLIKRVTEYPNMYVIRPQYFISFLALVAQVNGSFSKKVDEWNAEKAKMDDACMSKQEMEKNIESLKQSIIVNSLKNIINSVNNINNQAEKIQASAQIIVNSSRIILETHINTIKNKIESFSWKKLLKNVETINNFQVNTNLDFDKNTNSNIAYCKTKKEN